MDGVTGPQARNTSHVVKQILWTHQLLHKITSTREIVNKVCAGAVCRKGDQPFICMASAVGAARCEWR